MRLFLPFLTAGLLLSPLVRANDPAYRICYLSLNSEEEFHTTKDFMDKLNEKSAVKIEVKEFQTVGTDPDNSFKKMMDSGTRCDGLVISGHHTGGHGGKRAVNKLTLNFLEKYSCDPKYQEFFRNVSAVWLQGCRTSGVGEITPVTESKQNFDPEFHVRRVGSEIESDRIDTGDQSFARLSMEFTNTLDQDNPLESRYLRIFPEAKIFGWTNSAPGEKSHSERSILYHLAHVSRLMKDEYPENPLAPDLSPRSAAQYVDAAIATLHKFGEQHTACDEIAVKGWVAHGNYRTNPLYSFDNDDLRATEPLYSVSPDFLLEEAKEFNCLLKEAARTGNENLLSAAFNRMVSRPELLPYLFNSLVDIRNELAKKGSPMAHSLLAKMRSHPGMKEFFEKKIHSKQTGVLRKIDYYSFYRDLTGEKNPGLEKVIQQKTVEVLTQPILVNSPRSNQLAKNYRATLFQSLTKNGIASEYFLSELMAKDPETDVLHLMAANLDRVKSRGERMALLREISRSQFATESVGISLLEYMVTRENSGNLNYTSSREYQELYADLIGTSVFPGRLRGVGQVPQKEERAKIPPGSYQPGRPLDLIPGNRIPSQSPPPPQRRGNPFENLGGWLRNVFH